MKVQNSVIGTYLTRRDEKGEKKMTGSLSINGSSMLTEGLLTIYNNYYYN